MLIVYSFTFVEVSDWFDCSQFYVSPGHISSVHVFVDVSSNDTQLEAQTCFCVFFVDSSMQGWSGNETITVGNDEQAAITLPYVRPRNLLAKLNPFSYLWNAFSSMRFSVGLVPKRNGTSDAFNVTFGQNAAKLPVMSSNPDDMVLMTATGESVARTNTMHALQL